MSARRIFHKSRHALSNAYIAPWRDRERTRILLAGFLGSFSYGLQSLSLNYAMAGEGLQASMTFQILRMILMSSLFIPLSFWFLSLGFSKLTKGAVIGLCQVLATSLYMVDPKSGVINAIAFAITSAPFWGLYSFNYAMKQSALNRGNETALSNYLLVVSAAAGIFFGGLFLQKGWYLPSVIGGALGGTLATLFIILPVHDRHLIRKAWSFLGRDKPSTRTSFLTCLLGAMMEGSLPIWMRVIGLSPLSAGLNMSLRPILGLIITPMVGRLIQNGTLRAGQIGGGAMLTGSLLMAASINYNFLLLPAMLLLAIATHFMGPAEVGRWYKKRSAVAVMCREFLVGAGRVPGFAISIPVIYALPVAYPFVALVFSGIFLYGIRPRRKGLRGTPFQEMPPS